MDDADTCVGSADPQPSSEDPIASALLMRRPRILPAFGGPKSCLLETEIVAPSSYTLIGQISLRPGDGSVMSFVLGRH